MELLSRVGAVKELARLPREHQRRITSKIDDLGEDPRPDGVQKLTGEEDLYRIHVGDYRIVYEVHDRERKAVVLRIGHRSEIYR